MWLRIIKEIFDVGHDITQHKRWYTSKTIWFNVLVLCFDVLAKLWHELPVTGEEIDALALGLAACGNILLRFRTRRPVVLRAGRVSTGGDR
ncbi:hypothetical protein [Thermodesulforhabdus norvegica]|uniref:Uncharacterized protein n=1 Tax=Thermodesulforhabdus norvegica TaxID=39841 RepID=A0A1I4SUJ3_9BACT|nr:hypothetical protein [Thermodesulforhabdus norvegica]SFM68208.1 hypothetical protein SAMN05660836_01176 [Thermodesulforhabdus norvegica]